MKVAIVGSRRYENKKKIKDFVFRIKEQYGSDTIIVSGGCKSGADKYAKKYALELGLQYCTMPSSRYGRSYSVKNFHARNKIIAGTSDVVAAFIPEDGISDGTFSTLKYAKKFNKKRIIIN